MTTPANQTNAAKCQQCGIRPRIKKKTYCCPCLRPLQIARRKAKWDTLTVTPKCKRCDARPAARALWVYGNIRCYPCFNSTAARKTGKARYRATAKGEANTQHNLAKRVYLSGRTLVAKTPEDAAAIRAHIRRRVHDFVSQQKEAACHSRVTVGKSES